MRKIFFISALLVFNFNINAQTDSVKKIFYQNFQKISPDYFIKKAFENLRKRLFIETERNLKIAILLEPDSIKKAEDYYYAAVAEFALQNLPESRRLALIAAEYNPKYCKPYMLIAKLYAESKSICSDEFFGNAVFWAAVDKLKQAKATDCSCNEEADKLIQRYKERFPSTTGFSIIREGHKYKVGCWINEETIVRLK